MKKFSFMNKESIKYISLLGTLGLTPVLNLVVAIYLYKLFEKYFFKSLVVFIAFIFLAIINAFYSIYKNIMK